MDGFEWVCFDCAHLVHRVEVQLQAIDEDLQKVMVNSLIGCMAAYGTPIMMQQNTVQYSKI